MHFRHNHAIRLVALSVMIGAMPRAALAAPPVNPVEWSARVKKGPSPLKPGSVFTALVTATIADGWHLYSMDEMEGGPTPTWIIVPDGQPFTLKGKVREPQPTVEFDPNFNLETRYFENSVSFEMSIKAAATVPPGTDTVRIDVRYQTCNDRTCLPPKVVTLSVPVKIEPGAKGVAGAAQRAGAAPESVAGLGSSMPSVVPENAAVATSSVASEKTTSSAAVESSRKAETLNTVPRSQSLGSFIWLAAVMGALSLLTPCVFPMIPITVSYFTNHAGGNRKSAIFTAIIYAIGIILTFTALGMLLAVLFGAGGVNQLAANPWVNLLITTIFLGFAFSLFGAYFIQIPPSLMDKLDSLMRSKEGSQVIGALLMGFTFTLTSFTCTAPFVGTLLVMTAQGNWRWPLAGMLTFSTVFAIPFFALALAPQLLARLPKAGGWMVSVKVVMGFLEIAAAMKFLSNTDLVWHWGIFTRQVVLAVWVGIGVLTVLYLLGYVRMEHDSPIESIGATRLAFAMVFLALTIWLIPGLFGRELGELESFLPPELGTSASQSGAGSASSANPKQDDSWILNDYPAALARAKQTNKPIFIDFTGYTCTNCRWMEANIFPRAEVKAELAKFVRVRLYTDGSGSLYESQQKMESDRFGTVALPLYVILSPEDKSAATFPGLTRSPEEFLAFLAKYQRGG
jgi:thiol:disulfide interchange protein